jgi:hypothetical protein
MQLAGAADGTLRFAWTDRTQQVHVIRIDAAGQRYGAEITTPGEDVRALFAHDDGDVAVLVRRDIRLILRRLGPDGAMRFETVLVGAEGMATEGTRWADMTIRGAAIAWDGTRYTVYMTVKGNWGARGVHEGDLLANVSAAGMRMSGGWNWGCSHSLDLRLVRGAGTTLAPFCLSDSYPRPGLIFNNRTLVVEAPPLAPAGTIGSGYVARPEVPLLGGVVADGTGYLMLFASNTMRPARDVAILRFEGTTAAPRRWLTALASGATWAPDLMRLGTNLLAYWETSPTMAGNMRVATLQELDPTGAPRGAAVTMNQGDRAAPLAFRGWEVPAISVPNGDAAWVGLQGANGVLRVVRVRACR